MLAIVLILILVAVALVFGGIVLLAGGFSGDSFRVNNCIPPIVFVQVYN